MKLNRVTGQALGGKNAMAHIDGRMILPSGCSAAWLNEETVIYGQRQLPDPTQDVTNPDVLLESRARNDQSFIRTYHVPTGTKKVLIDRPFNGISAGGNRWVAWLGGYGIYGDMRDPVGGLPYGPWFDQAVSWDGTIAIIPNYQKGAGMTLYAVDGRVTEVPDWDEQFPVQYGFKLCGPTSAIWSGTADGIRGINVRVPSVQLGFAHEPIRIEVPTASGTDEWITYWSNSYGAQVLHPYDELKGYVINTSGNAYWPDAMYWKGKIRIAFSWRQGELVDDARIMDVDLKSPRTVLKQPAGNPTPKGTVEDAKQAAAKRIYLTGDLTANLAVRADSDTSLVRPQLGLYEDDIVYRLSMLATNVLEPLKKQYPTMVIKSGFREVNGGMGQHEKGEAVDIQLSNQTDDRLLQCAKWIRDNLPFDQLILNWSQQSSPWIHVSFSPDSLRQDVQTKDLADNFTQGLAIVRPLVGEAAAAQLREQKVLDTLIISEMEAMQARESRGGVATVYADAAMDAGASGYGVYAANGEPGGGGSGTGNGTEYSGVVKCVIDQLYKNGVPAGFSNEQKCFNVVLRVAWLLRTVGVGLCKKEGGSNTFKYGGYEFSSQRICFADGTSYDIIGGASEGNLHPQWNPDSVPAGPDKYVVALDPGTDINMDWLTCQV